MSVIEKLNSFISGRKLEKAVEGKSDKEKFAAVTGITHVSDEMLEDEKSAWFVPGGLFSKSDVNETQTEPEGPAEPTDPETPTEPAEPTDPETPAEPAEPTDPETPETPAEPTDPETPETPAEPETPETPAEPTDPETPAEPTEPADDNTGSEVDIETQG